MLPLAHDTFGNPSFDEMIPAVLAGILLAVVIFMAFIDHLKGHSSSTSSALDHDGDDPQVLD